MSKIIKTNFTQNTLDLICNSNNNDAAETQQEDVYLTFAKDFINSLPSDKTKLKSILELISRNHNLFQKINQDKKYDRLLINLLDNLETHEILVNYLLKLDKPFVKQSDVYITIINIAEQCTNKDHLMDLLFKPTHIESFLFKYLKEQDVNNDVSLTAFTGFLKHNKTHIAQHKDLFAENLINMIDHYPYILHNPKITNILDIINDDKLISDLLIDKIPNTKYQMCFKNYTNNPVSYLLFNSNLYSDSELYHRIIEAINHYFGKTITSVLFTDGAAGDDILKSLNDKNANSFKQMITVISANLGEGFYNKYSKEITQAWNTEMHNHMVNNILEILNKLKSDQYNLNSSLNKKAIFFFNKSVATGFVNDLVQVLKDYYNNNLFNQSRLDELFTIKNRHIFKEAQHLKRNNATKILSYISDLWPEIFTTPQEQENINLLKLADMAFESTHFRSQEAYLAKMIKQLKLSKQYMFDIFKTNVQNDEKINHLVITSLKDIITNIATASVDTINNQHPLDALFNTFTEEELILLNSDKCGLINSIEKNIADQYSNKKINLKVHYEKAILMATQNQDVSGKINKLKI